MKTFLVLCMIATTAWGQDYHQLQVDQAQADSFLQSNWNKYQENYHPNYAFDGNPKTAWVEGVEGLGEGQGLSWDVSKLETVSVVKLRIRNGYQKSASLFKANGSVKDAVLILVGKQQNFQTAQKITLKQEMGWQEFEFPLSDNHGLTHLKLVINSAYEGKTYKDTCVSDVEIWVKSKTPYNAVVEKEKRQRLMKWTAERLKAAKFFANTPPAYPFAATKFRKTSERNYYPESMRGSEYLEAYSEFFDKEPPSNFLYATELSEVGTLMQKYGVKRGEKSGWHRQVVDKTKVGTFSPDGLDAAIFNVASSDLYSDALMRYMLSENVSLFETNKEVAQVVVVHQNTDGSKNTRSISNAQVRREEGKVRAISFWVEDAGIERGPYKYYYALLFVYKDGLLEWAIHDQVGFKFSYDQQGKVSKVLQVGHVVTEFEEAPYYWKIFDADAAALATRK